LEKRSGEKCTQQVSGTAGERWMQQHKIELDGDKSVGDKTNVRTYLNGLTFVSRNKSGLT